MAGNKGTDITTQLMTLLNVSATKPPKRKRDDEDSNFRQKLNKRKSIQFEDSTPSMDAVAISLNTVDAEIVTANGVGEEEDAKEELAEVEDAVSDDPYELHFGVKTELLSESRRKAAEDKSWNASKSKLGRIGNVVEYTASDPSAAGAKTKAHKLTIIDKLKTTFEERQAKIPKELAELQNDLLAMLSSHRDLYVTRTSPENQRYQREAIMLHAINHVTKWIPQSLHTCISSHNMYRKRRSVLKSNERIARAAKTETATPEDVQDQGFTRPSVLVLLPFRSYALHWLSALTANTPSPSYQIENHSRFQSEYGLPPGAVDKLATAEPGLYPKDHVEILGGNVDDSFRVGIKMTRKSVKLFAEFYGCDIIFASPLGLRMSIQKEKSADFLSSIEMLIVDQMDALTMQNWDHVQFVMSHMNQLPKESHNADFSRIKPWYLDGHAAFLRQSIFMTAYETPETRSLFSSLKNVAGKEFSRFDCSSPQDEADKRFSHFTTQTMPAVLKSAVKSVNTVIFVPSSFDFIRVHNYFRRANLQFTVLSEYSSNQDISRARQSFFNGKKAFLLVSERFHFFRRYKLRGIRNLIFYGPPDHAQFYAEFISYPFLDDGVEPSDVSCRVLYSKYDWMRLERIAGTDGAAALTKQGVQ
ncbi:hypothetical protein EUX98_g3765 [Antrodiella citrinella]|uniref:U3 small nucleolar RNA-associated protein 25 n=1 Tax=Antrodiella citrinella TaxID=2447956 RepID=A0A4S4MVN9_9APHY|nr:hypothetical protein EUX98_g3765 [Antrodiella citrinella]